MARFFENEEEDNAFTPTFVLLMLLDMLLEESW
jgi:hypothetical protein